MRTRAWERHVIAGPFPRMINAAPYDIDGDGIPEIALAYEFANVAKNSLGVLVDSAVQGWSWEPKEIDRVPTSHRLRWADLFGTGKKVLVNAVLTSATAEPPGYEGRHAALLLRPEGLETPVRSRQRIAASCTAYSSPTGIATSARMF